MKSEEVAAKISAAALNLYKKEVCAVAFSEKIKALRTASKMSQRELAARLGIGKSQISYYENGERFPSADILVKTADIFRVTTDYLLDVSREKVINLSDLSDEDIAVVRTVADALKNK